MRYVVTGSAGFIGAHLSARLLADGHDVLGIDAFTDYYDPAIKRARVERLAARSRYRHVAADLAAADMGPLLAGADAVLHLAGQPGVRLSWADGFDVYLRRNVFATQRILETVLRSSTPAKVVVASSSSVYGNAPAYPTTESSPTRPFSPYGVTKLAMEHLCWSYVENWGLDVVGLRYFTVYGPGQRPDMALHRFIRRALAGEELEVFGDGEQRRDFTYVADVVAATISAGQREVPRGSVLNVSGGAQATVNELLDLVGLHTGRTPRVVHRPAQAGDVRETGGSTALAGELLGWAPQTSLSDGVAAQVQDLVVGISLGRQRRAADVAATAGAAGG